MHSFNKKLISLLLVVIIIVSIIPTEVYAYDIQPYKGDFNIIAYSVLDNINDAPINTAEHYRICCAGNYPFTSIKGDVRLTSDNRIIMCHDQGYTLNSKGRIVSYNASNSIDIHNLSYRQCMSLKYAQKYKGDNIGVCDFETYIKICSNYNKQAFITIRDQYIPEILRAMMPIIYKYNMQSKCIINSFSIDSLRIVKKYDSNISLSWVIGESGFSKTSIDEAKKLGNCMISLYSFPTDKFGGFDTLDSHIELFSYAQREAVPIYVAIVESVSYIDQLKKYGISGAQVRSLNKTETQESIDRLGRNYEDVIEQWKRITKDKKADIVVIDMPILDTRRGKDLMGTFLSDIVLSLLSYVSENERINIRQRQAEGISAAKERGTRFGPCPIKNPDNFEEIYVLWKTGVVTISEGARLCNMARSTFYNHIIRYDMSKKTSSQD